MSGAQVIGVSVRGPQPLGWVHLPLENGVSALYGKNGAGKTRLLDAVADALLGVENPGALGLVHVFVPDPVEIWWGADWTSKLETAAAAHVNRARAASIERLVRWRDENFQKDSWDGAPEEALERLGSELASEEYSPVSISESVAAQVAALRVARQTIDDDEASWRALGDELAGGGSFTLRAVGTITDPKWDVYASALPSMATAESLVRAQMGLLDFQRRYRAGEFVDVLPEQLMKRFEGHLHEASGILFPWDGPLTMSADVFSGFAIDLAEVTARTVHEDWPEWTPRPLLKIAEIGELPVRVLAEKDATDDASAATRSALIAIGGTSLISIADSNDVNYTPDVASALEAIERNSNATLAMLLDPAPTVRFRSGGLDDWFAGRPPTWEMQDPQTGHWFPLTQASQAQLRWARLAIAIATERVSDAGRSIVLLADEPELGLHAKAEASLPRVLSRFASELGTTVLVATHSAAMLDDSNCRPIHVTKFDRTVARGLAGLRSGVLRELQLDELGLTRSAVFQLARAFVLVEGKHDEVVLKALLADDLRAGSAEIIPMGGAKQLPAMAYATWLWNLTDARIVVVLDGIASEAIAPIWSRAREHSAEGRHLPARSALRALDDLDGGEPKWLRAFLEQALETGTWSRITLATLPAPDIICYLPPDEFVPGSTWDQIIARWRAESRGAAVDLKGYLKRTTGRAVSVKSIERALRSAVPHADLLELGSRVRHE